ncbi:hypothetical protein [Nonomuraea sp. NPDC052265]|uniref:hypothetical protein n=1 Tax=Nonomuraea sp. NPDC052265 TaxID=3364374 RepID=UPI0037CBA2BB
MTTTYQPFARTGRGTPVAVSVAAWKDMHPAFAVLIVAASAALVAAVLRAGRR